MSNSSTNLTSKLDEVRADAMSKTKQLIRQQLVDETNQIYAKQLNHEFQSQDKIMNQNQIISIASIQEQELNTKIIICVASVWMVTISCALFAMLRAHIINFKVALIGTIGTWVIGLCYLAWYLYTHANNPTEKEIVNDASYFTKAFLRASLPNSLQPKCPSECQVSYDSKNQNGNVIYNNDIKTFTTYPSSQDYWKGGIPSFEPISQERNPGISIQPEAIVSPLNPPLQTFTCVNMRDNSIEITSAQPCDVYPGFTDQEELKNEEPLEWGMKQTMFQRKN